MSGRPMLRPVEAFSNMSDLTDALDSPSPAGPVGPHRYLLVSSAELNSDWLNKALWEQGRLLPFLADPPGEALNAQIARFRPQALFIDFCVPVAAVQSVQAMLARQWPGLPVIGLGRASDATSMLGALRAGVHDFVDMDAPASDALALVNSVLRRRPAERSESQGQTVALLGARSGLGVSTLAASLSLVLQGLSTPAHPSESAEADPMAENRPQGVALVDLGLPVRDSLMYLDSESNFSFVDGVRNLRRLDHTLVSSALTHHSSGLSVLPLPAALTQMREISHADSVSLIRRLDDFFAYRVLDLGGFAPVDFMAQVARAAEHVWVVCDQSIGGIVSTASLLRELSARGLNLEGMKLVINQYDPQAGLSPQDIAEKLGLPLAHVVPARRAALLAAASRGQMLVQSARNDAYTQAVQALARLLQGEADVPASPHASGFSLLNALRSRLSAKRSGGKSS